MDTALLNTLWGQLIIEELVRNDCRYFCIAPGSRSTPLTAAVGRRQDVQTMVHFDERGLAFHALGYAAATGKPAVVICTSGTALANMFPAVIEASKKKLPLIILSADRPVELRQTGAHQTIDQVKIFGSYVKFFTDMPAAEINVPASFILSTIDQAYFQSINGQAGVVHLNCMFREPLITKLEKSKALNDYQFPIQEWLKHQKPFTQYIQTTAATTNNLDEVTEVLNKSKQGVIVIGKVNRDAIKPIIALAKKWQWPILADISSGLRLGHEDDVIIHYFDQILLNESFAKKFKPDVILHLGGRITSKRFYQWLGLNNFAHYIMVLGHALRHDPTHQVSMRIVGSVSVCCQHWLKQTSAKQLSAFTKFLMKANKAIGDSIDSFLHHQGKLNEISVARLISQMIPSGHGLFLSNSMPIRDMDMYGDYQAQEVVVNGNRGASGIDGIIASASGFAQGLKQPVTLSIGDLAALYDVNSLAMLRDIPKPLIIIILNNGGGGIFSFLPHGLENGIFQKFYATPHSYSFAHAAGGFELNYHQPMDVESFKKNYRQALKSDTSTIIEVMTAQESNFKLHESLKIEINQIVSHLQRAK